MNLFLACQAVNMHHDTTMVLDFLDTQGRFDPTQCHKNEDSRCFVLFIHSFSYQSRHCGARTLQCFTIGIPTEDSAGRFQNVYRRRQQKPCTWCLLVYDAVKRLALVPRPLDIFHWVVCCDSEKKQKWRVSLPRMYSPLCVELDGEIQVWKHFHFQCSKYNVCTFMPLWINFTRWFEGNMLTTNWRITRMSLLRTKKQSDTA